VKEREDGGGVSTKKILLGESKGERIAPRVLYGSPKPEESFKGRRALAGGKKGVIWKKIKKDPLPWESPRI